MSSTTYTLAIPSKLRHLRKVRHFVARHTKDARFPDHTVEAIKLAVDEACSNVIKHAYGGKSGHSVEINLTVTPSCLTVTICDHGRPFDETSYTTPEIPQLVKQKRSGGLGVHIIRQLMDEVEYQSVQGRNELRLVINRSPQERALHTG